MERTLPFVTIFRFCSGLDYKQNCFSFIFYFFCFRFCIIFLTVFHSVRYYRKKLLQFSLVFVSKLKKKKKFEHCSKVPTNLHKYSNINTKTLNETLQFNNGYFRLLD